MNNPIKIILCSILLFLLSSCATTTTTGKIVKKETDDIVSFKIDSKYLYVSGNKHDYQFLIQKSDKLSDFIQSEYYKKITFIDATAYIYNNKSMNAMYALFISPDNLTSEQQEELLNKYRFNYICIDDGNIEYWVSVFSENLKNKLTQESNLLVRSYSLTEGQPTTLENRNTLLNNYIPPIPVQLHIKHSNLSKEVDFNKSFDQLPESVKIVLSIPALIWWAASTN